jgi:hypothetical protein
MLLQGLCQGQRTGDPAVWVWNDGLEILRDTQIDKTSGDEKKSRHVATMTCICMLCYEIDLPCYVLLLGQSIEHADRGQPNEASRFSSKK